MMSGKSASCCITSPAAMIRSWNRSHHRSWRRRRQRKVDDWWSGEWVPLTAHHSPLYNEGLEANMFQVTREIRFCYGHRLLEYAGKCRHLHGHNGRAVISLAATQLDPLGMVMDFSHIKR